VSTITCAEAGASPKPEKASNIQEIGIAELLAGFAANQKGGRVSAVAYRNG
jgi:hypothetical protein